MKWLIFVSILGAGYCEMMVGGREDLDIAKIKKETKAEYLSMSRSAIDDALSELGLEKLDKDDEIKLKKVQTQVRLSGPKICRSADNLSIVGSKILGPFHIFSSSDNWSCLPRRKLDWSEFQYGKQTEI